MSVLILSLPGDRHSLAVKYAIESKGVPVDLLCWSDFPQLLRVSFGFRATGTGAEIKCHRPNSASIDSSAVVSFWNHRSAPSAPHPEISKFDHEAIRISADALLNGLLGGIENTAFTVNSSESKRRFDNKITQLSVAQACGLSVPRTLISNDYSEVVAFLEEVGSCVIKPLRYLKWNLGRTEADLKTTRMKSIENIRPVAIEACPMIYQEEIRKLCEYRVVVFGREMKVFRLNSQRRRASSLDWRAVDYRTLDVSVGALNENTRERLFSFVDQSGFVSGSFDLAVDRSGNLIFFEFNESGQFLWLEELCPDVPLLDIFSQFLIEGDPQFKYFPREDVVHFERFRSEIAVNFICGQAFHVPVNLDRRFREF